ncbi:MAG: GrpB family protein [Halanaerobiaceae bacterium]
MTKKLSEMSLEELWELFPIRLQDYNPEYKIWYQEEKEQITSTVGPEDIKRISHIGSTAVEGLVAKPIVDILLEVDSNCDIKELKSKLISAGWILMSCDENPELNLSFNKGYTPEGFAERAFHLHVRNWGDPDELYFRDYLRSNRKVAAKYGELKQKLKDKYKHNRDGYTEAKFEFINKWTQKARKKFGNRYLPVE